MKIYNTLTRKKEEFKPIKKGVVKMYTCGPTVYDYAHIGNLRTYVNEDLLRRTLKYFGYKVDQAMNITDIEDKIINRSKVLGVRYQDITKKYEKAFFEDLKKLNIEPVEYIPHATDPKVIKKMIEIIQKLLDGGYAYKSDDGSVYFSIKKFKNYGKLSGLEKRELKSGARVSQDEYEKDNAQDFALWKAKKEGEPSWRAPFGEGRPGWHIECSAMSTMILGDTIDIHAGAVDLIFPHHENEIAQSEAYTGKKFVNYWWHPEFLLVEGKKMSKSLKNIYTLDKICKKYGVLPLSFRLLCLQSHYRSKLNFTRESIISSDRSLTKLRAFMVRLNTYCADRTNPKVSHLIKQYEREFRKHLENDLSIPEALASVHKFINKIEAEKNINANEADSIKKQILDFDVVLGLGLDNIKAKAAFVVYYTEKKRHPLSHDEKIDTLFWKYIDAKAKEDFVNSDKIRRQIIDMSSWTIEDHKDDNGRFSILRKK